MTHHYNGNALDEFARIVRMSYRFGFRMNGDGITRRRRTRQELIDESVEGYLYSMGTANLESAALQDPRCIAYCMDYDEKRTARVRQAGKSMEAERNFARGFSGLHALWGLGRQG